MQWAWCLLGTQSTQYIERPSSGGTCWWRQRFCCLINSGTSSGTSGPILTLSSTFLLLRTGNNSSTRPRQKVDETNAIGRWVIRNPLILTHETTVWNRSVIAAAVPSFPSSEVETESPELMKNHWKYFLWLYWRAKMVSNSTNTIDFAPNVERSYLVGKNCGSGWFARERQKHYVWWDEQFKIVEHPPIDKEI